MSKNMKKIILLIVSGLAFMAIWDALYFNIKRQPDKIINPRPYLVRVMTNDTLAWLKIEREIRDKVDSLATVGWDRDNITIDTAIHFGDTGILYYGIDRKGFTNN
jgi:hypothetical protein